MAPLKGKKRALSFDSDDEGAGPVSRGGKKASGRGKADDGDEWSAWQDSARTQEADRVQQYVKTFQRDVVQKALDNALADLQLRETERAEHQKQAHERIVAECTFLDGGDAAHGFGASGASDVSDKADSYEKHPLYAAGCQVLELLESTLQQYHATEAVLKELAGDGDYKHGSSDGRGSGFEGLRSSWDNDLVEARKLLEYGRAYGDGLVRDIIVPSSGSTAPTTPAPGLFGSSHSNANGSAGASAGSALNQTGKAAVGMYPRSSTVVASRDTWGEAAQSQMEVLSRLMKTMDAGANSNRTSAFGGPVGGYGFESERKTVRFDL